MSPTPRRVLPALKRASPAPRQAPQTSRRVRPALRNVPPAPRLADRSLGGLLLPILVPLITIAFRAFAELLEFSNSFIAFLGNANFALFVGFMLAYFKLRAAAGLERTRNTMHEGFHTTGEILLITGLVGSLGAVIEETDLDTMLAGLFWPRQAPR